MIRLRAAKACSSNSRLLSRNADEDRNNPTTDTTIISLDRISTNPRSYDRLKPASILDLSLRCRIQPREKYDPTRAARGKARCRHQLPCIFRLKVSWPEYDRYANLYCFPMNSASGNPRR